MPEAVFHPEFREDLHSWAKADAGVARRVLELVEETLRDPRGGGGRPLELKGVLAGCYSRRITLQHRLVYRVVGERVHFLLARYHW